jgi:ABC-type ATPase with predicted acetyltransferase domain
VLSNGEQFRAMMAQLLLTDSTPHDGFMGWIIDEFTSVLDRQVAQVGAGAFAKSWRRQPGRKIVMVTPHYDILDWVQPDWVIDTHGGERLPGEERKVVLAREGDFQEATDHARYPGDRVATLEC